jgi:hypothetical protein
MLLTPMQWQTKLVPFWSTCLITIPIMSPLHLDGHILVHLFNHDPNYAPSGTSWLHFGHLVNIDPNFVPPGLSWSNLIDLVKYDPNFVTPENSGSHFGQLGKT